MGLFKLLRWVVIGALVYYGTRWLKRLLAASTTAEEGDRRDGAAGDRRHGGQGSESTADPHRSPYEVLGVSRTASRDEVREAYQRLVKQYHPDRVAGMGPELRDVAERRTKEINAAYAAIKKR